MPEIIPVAVPIPTASAPVAGVASATPAANDASAGDFMGQLTAALKSLKGLATAVKAAPGATLQPDGTLGAPIEAAPAAQDDATPDGSKPTTPSDEIVELLATLGLVLVPTPRNTPPAGTATTGANRAQAVPGATTPQALAATAMQTPNAPEKVPAELTQAESKLPATAEPAKQAAPAAVPRMTHAADAAAALPATDPRASAQQQAVTPQAQSAQPSAPAAPTGPQPQIPFGTNPDAAFQQSGDGRHSHEHAGAKAEPVGAAQPSTAVPERTYAEAAGLAMRTSHADAAQASADVRAADVAAQIAQQVDLYRLPGNKGVRIQLHPEDLGGVQVTLRYAAGGSLELHINVEHAATGNLVQAGLSQLRDALATQGFQPDRVVMSVTAPPSAGQMDFSGSNSGNGSYRSEAGLTSFTQDGQSGQQSAGGDDQRGPRGWKSTDDSTDDSPRVSSSTSTSVIDYRV